MGKPNEKDSSSVPLPIVFPSRRLLIFSPAPFPQPVRTAFEGLGYWVDLAQSESVFFQLLKKHSMDLVLYCSDVSGLGWEHALAQVLKESVWTHFVLMLSKPDPRVAVRAMKLGAWTVLSATDSPDEIISECHFESALKEEPGALPVHNESVLVGRSDSFRKIHAVVERLKEVDSTVLITGESGTGKELMARAIHDNSPFRSGPFMAVNCGAIPENLLESELFGHVKGAFTDAVTDHKGIFEACQNGTLLLDEIGDMPLLLQVKLLRFLEDRMVTPVGSTHSVKVNVRVLASTNHDLDDLVKQGRFRRDLFFRLAVIKIHLPPLRDRKTDVQLLVKHYVEFFCTRFKKSVPRISNELWARLLTYEWPGNVRELRNVVERGVALSVNGEMQLEEVLPCPKDSGLSFPHFCPLNAANQTPASYQEVKSCCEKSYLTRLLQLSEGNLSEVARLAGRHRTEIYRQLEKYSLDPKKFEKP